MTARMPGGMLDPRMLVTSLPDALRKLVRDQKGAHQSPKEIVVVLNREMNAALKLPDVVAKLHALGLDVFWSLSSDEETVTTTVTVGEDSAASSGGGKS